MNDLLIIVYEGDFVVCDSSFWECLIPEEQKVNFFEIMKVDGKNLIVLLAIRNTLLRHLGKFGVVTGNLDLVGF